jgi:hypothetical protein
MGLYNKFKNDKGLETKGVIIDYGDFRVTVARAGGSNKKFARILETRTKPYKTAIRTDTLDKEVSKNIMLETYSEAIILNWETKIDGKFKQGIENEKQELIPFNQENCLLTLQELPDLFIDIQDQAMNASLYRQDILEADSKN